MSASTTIFIPPPTIHYRKDGLLRLERRFGVPFRWGMFLVGSISVWTTQQVPFPRAAALGLAVFMAFAFTMSVLVYGPWREKMPVWLVPVATIVDSLAVLFLIPYSGGVGSELYLLYFVLAVKVALCYPFVHWLIFLPFLYGPLYILSVYLQIQSLLFLLSPAFVLRYLILFAMVLAALYVAWLLERRYRLIRGLNLALEEQGQELRRKTSVLQRTATDLGDRVMQLRSLQEGIKTINSAVALESLLAMIVANASQVLRGTRCSIALLDEASGEVVTLAASGVPQQNLWGSRFPVGKGVAGWVVAHAAPVLIGDVSQDSRYIRLGQLPVQSIVSVPLMSDGKAIGALSATSPEDNAFTPDDLNLLAAFADQAAIAVKKARLYEDLAREKRQTEQIYRSVQEKSNELEAVLQGIGDGVLVTDTDLNLVMMNPVAVRIFGVEEDPLLGRPLAETVGHRELHDVMREALAAPGKPVIREIRVPMTREHPEMIYQALATTIPGAAGEARGVVTVLRDVTSQKQLEQMKSNFLSVVSHELKTPLHSIKGFVDIILMGKTGKINDLQRDFLTTVREQTDQLQNLISELLEFSRLESGQIRLRIEEVSFADIAARVADKLSPQAQEAQIALEMTIPADFATVEADATRMEQVLTNLVDNAIKFTPAGGRIVISGEDLGDRVLISVADTGIGIPPSEREKIFERFYQVDSGATRPYRGTGLGLSICKHIVEHHRGRIWVEGAEPQGSVFKFILPKRLEGGRDLSLDFTTLPSDASRQ
ncbi:MAG: ATP-binding protein [Anaerolineae bacterium]|nr:ATP-binding protein [Anaerolineae bacterium]